MFWLFLWIVLLIVSILLIWLGYREIIDEVEGEFLGALFIIVAVVGLIIYPISIVLNKQYVKTWDSVKATYEGLSTDQLNNISIGVKIGELNQELFKKQFIKENYSFFTTLPKEVLDLKPINTKGKGE